MIPAADPRRRRQVLLAVVGAVVVIVTTFVVLGVVLQSVALGLFGLQVLLFAATASLTPFGPFAPASGRRRLAALHDVVRPAVPDDAGTMLVRVAGAALSGVLGVRVLWTSPVMVLVDDEDGLALWTQRRGVAGRVVRWPWAEVREAVARDDGGGVELRMVDPSEPAVVVTPLAATGESTVHRVLSPSHNHELAARLRRSMAAANPDAAAPQEPRRSGDVDWLG